MSSSPTPMQLQTYEAGVPVRRDALQVLTGAADLLLSVQTLWSYPGNGGTLGPNQTIFTVPGGYVPGFVKVRIVPFDITDFTATDGETVVIPGYTFGPDDVVQIEILKAKPVADAASKAEVDGKLDTTGEGGAVVITAPFTDAQSYALAERSGDEVSVMSFIPKSLRAAIRASTSNADVTAYVRKALATGRNVYLPKGRYRVTDSLPLLSGQVMIGDGAVFSIIAVDAAFNMSASAVIAVTAGDSSGFDGIGIEFDQSGANSRATLRKYPWALDISTATRFKIGRLRLTCAWNGIRGEGNCGGLDFGLLEIGAFNLGLRLNGLLDFAHGGCVHAFPWGITGQSDPLEPLYRDGIATAVSFGKIDGLDIRSLCVVNQPIKFTAEQTSGISRHIAQIHLDSNAAYLLHQGGDTQVGMISSTKDDMSGQPALVNDGGTLIVGQTRMWGGQGASQIQVTGGRLQSNGGFIQQTDPGRSGVLVTGGIAAIKGTYLQPEPTQNRSVPFVSQTGGALVFTDNWFAVKSNGSGEAVKVASDNPQNDIRNNNFGLWSVTVPNGTPSGSYGPNVAPPETFAPAIAFESMGSFTPSYQAQQAAITRQSNGYAFDVQLQFAAGGVTTASGQLWIPLPLGTGDRDGRPFTLGAVNGIQFDANYYTLTAVYDAPRQAIALVQSGPNVLAKRLTAANIVNGATVSINVSGELRRPY